MTELQAEQLNEKLNEIIALLSEISITLNYPPHAVTSKGVN